MKSYTCRLPVNITIKTAIKLEKLCELESLTPSKITQNLIINFYQNDEKVKNYLKKIEDKK